MTTLTRRQVLGGVAGLAVGGVGIGAFSRPGAALRTSFRVNDVDVRNDTGDVTRVFIRPTFDVRWGGFDEPVGRVRIVVEAKTRGEETYQPVFQMTPVLDGDNEFGREQGGTSGHYLADGDDRWWEITLFDEAGRPPYETLSGYPAGVEAYLNGTVQGAAADAPTWNGEPFVNNDFPVDEGYFGAAGTTDAFESTVDGENRTTTVDVRLTIALLAPPDAEDADHALLLYGTEGFPVVRDADREQTLGDTDVVDPVWLTYADLRHLHDAGHPAVEVVEASFRVRSENEPAEQGASVEGHGGAEGRDELPA
jgi:hypothetical protein